MKINFVFIIILSCICFPIGLYRILLRRTIAEKNEKAYLKIINRNKTHELMTDQDRIKKSIKRSLLEGIIYLLIPIVLLAIRLLAKG